MPREVLDRVALNRTLLERQLLARRATLPALAAVEHLVGLQAQATAPPYVALWSRLDGFIPDALSTPLLDRTAVRIVLMRGTVHLVSADDCLRLRPLVQSVLDRQLVGNAAYRRGLDGLDRDEFTSEAAGLLREQPRTNVQLRDLLHERWPQHDATALVQAARAYLPLVQLPPRGVWGAGGQVRTTTADDWLGRPLDNSYSVDSMVLRYLRAFGPASVRDVQTWSGLTALREVVDRLRPQLRVFRDENGVELVDTPDSPVASPDAPAPPRFLGEYDNALLSHADRSRIISDEHRKRLWTPNGSPPGTVLVDGFVWGSWRSESGRDRATLTIQSFGALSRDRQSELLAEAETFVRFAADGAAEHDVRLTKPQ